jgi:hypothetical protein
MLPSLQTGEQMRAQNCMRDGLRCAALALAACVLLGARAQADPNFVTFAIGDQTLPLAINSSGTVVGTYHAGDINHGFVRQPDGSIETFDVRESRGTFATSINENGEVTGNFYIKDARRGNITRGFVRKPNGKIKIFDVPQRHSAGIFPMTINSAGMIFGVATRLRTYSGFIRAVDGQLTAVDCPDGRTWLEAANDSGTATGTCNDGAYVRDPDGTFTFFDAGPSTTPAGINAAGMVAGKFGDSDTQGFVRAPDGTVSLFTVGLSAAPSGINDDGLIAGQSYSSGGFHGFVRSLDGTITTFDPEGSTRTEPKAINNSGVITGFYIDQSGDWVGFIRTP